MKKIIILCIACLFAGYTFAQKKEKKPKIFAAESARQKGNLGEAKEIIDRAIEHEKTKEDGKTWYYRGLIYATLDTISDPQYQNLAKEPLKEAMDAFKIADGLGDDYYATGENGLPVLKKQQIQMLWGYYLNKGVEYYQSEDSENAVKYFTKTQLVMPKDTTGYMYAGMAASFGEDYETAAKNYYKLINELDYESESVYSTLIYIESAVRKNNEKALELVRKVRAKYPDNADFSKSEISILIALDRLNEAEEELAKAIEKNPNDPQAYFRLGSMNEQLGNTEKAEEAYLKALELDPDSYNAIYNLAVMYYNGAADLIKERNNLTMSAADKKKSEAMLEAVYDKLRVALPYWEKANELKSEEIQTLETLEYLYTQLKMEDKAAAVTKQLKDIMGLK